MQILKSIKADIGTEREQNKERSDLMVECLSRGFQPHRRYCVVSLSKTHLSLLSTSTGSTQE